MIYYVAELENLHSFRKAEIIAAYFKLMVDKFGEKYIKDYFEYHTGVKV